MARRCARIIMNTAPAQTVAYNYSVVRQFTIATLIWGVIGMSMGAFIAAQLVWPQLNFDLPWTSFGLTVYQVRR